MPQDKDLLTPEDLERLTVAWERWAYELSSPIRIINRAKMHLLFLLIRYGGLRLGEALHLNINENLQKDTGWLKICGTNERNILLPINGMRSIRRILSLPDASEPEFLTLDPGFVRRTFYTVGMLISLDKALSGPRSIRHGRGLELLAMNMPIALVREYLGISKTFQLGKFLKLGASGANKILHSRLMAHNTISWTNEDNTFLCTILDMEVGSRSLLITLKTFSGLHLISLCSMQNYMRLELQIGQIAYVKVEPGQIFLNLNKQPYIFTNEVPCRILSIHKDVVESLIKLELANGDILLAEVESSILDKIGSRQSKQQIYAAFTARAVQLYLD